MTFKFCEKNGTTNREKRKEKEYIQYIQRVYITSQLARYDKRGGGVGGV